MSARRRPAREGRDARRPRSQDARARRGPGRAVLVAAGVLAIAIVALVWRSAARRPAPAAPDPQSAWAEYRAGVALGERGLHLEGLPHLRRALESPVDFWAFHADYGTALFNASFEIGPRAGAPRAVTRSSWERIAMIREAASQLEIAARMAPEPRDRALVEIHRADLLRTWGLPLDALAAYRRAESFLPDQPDLLRRTNEFLTTLRSAEDPGASAPRASR